MTRVVFVTCRGWDRMLVPDGYERTLAELGTSKYLVNMRHGAVVSRGVR